MITLSLLQIIYLLASISFIIGLKLMGHPRTARRGNIIAALGMTIAIFGTILLHEYPVSGLVYGLIATAIIVGTLIGWFTAQRVPMTKMPELVSLFNGMGGACAALISLIEGGYALDRKVAGVDPATGMLITIMAGLVIGSVSFSGSMIAFMKLNGTIQKNFRLPKYNYINIALMVAIFAASAFAVATFDSMLLVYVLLAAALVYGVLFIVPIGGADMPVVISLLNSFTGLAAAFGGFLYNNNVMLTGGILVGSAGTILTIVMCKAMNRSLANVLFGAFGEGAVTGAAGPAGGGAVKDISVSDLAVLMNYSKKVIIVPGYGLAVAQAQHVINEIETILVERGVEVKYAIHPVAGRMPGHMNVLLAESNVPYDKLLEMDEINPEFSSTDVALVVGANDVVNPAAKNDPTSPIYGMPILDVESAAHIIVNKRSMNAGYAGIDNELFFNPKTNMVFGDAKKVLTELVSELKSL